MVLVGGVPGAGKSTLLRRYAGRPGTLVLDPDTLRERLAWRPLVHLAHQLLVWAVTLAGPRLGRTVLIHDTATRPRRREALLGLARRRGWDVSLLLVEVSRATALTGQLERGRLAPAHAFERHWRRWLGLRDGAQRVAVPPLVVTRSNAPAVLDGLVRSGPEQRDDRLAQAG
ncbi:ATP-binding protein [Nocardioides rotundus]|uniref:ATP-binding protein n=1 Tax=Nocardioides rotundus TaxID=1774216 RepID=UPI001CC140A9|nr:ATP-binding protein [Nocardioides rotundus]